MVVLTAALSITLVRLPVYFGHDAVLRPLTIGVLLMCAAWAVPRKQHSLNHVVSAAAATFVAIVFVEVIRGSKAGVYSSPGGAAVEGVTYLAVLAFAITLLASARDEAERDKRLAALALAPGVYMAVNLLMHYSGAESPAAADPGSASLALGSPAQILNLLGIPATRIEFPMANSINNFGVAAAAGLAAAAALLLRTRIPRRFTVPAIAACSGCILLGDNRGSLLIAVAVILWFLVARRVRAAGGIAAIVPVLPIVVVGGFGLLANSGILDLFSRNAGDFTTGNNRLYIWEGAWEFLQQPTTQLLYGWGAGGHISSGASSRYAYVFTGRPDASSVHTHDLALQTLFDGGLLALAATTVVVAVTLTALAQRNGAAMALVAMLIVIVLCGATEVTPTYYSQEALLMTLLTVGAAAGVGRPQHAAAERTLTPSAPRSAAAHAGGSHELDAVTSASRG